MSRVRVTVEPLMEGVPLKVTVASLPPAGVFFTANAPLARFAAAARVSLKVSASDVPSTVAELSVGAVVSDAGVSFVTASSVKLATSLPAASASVLFVPEVGLV